MDSVIGIDLGTTNCCVAIVEDGRPRVLQDERGYPIQPSYVMVKGPNDFSVGHPAKTQVISNPKNTLYGVKRIIGRKFESPEVDAVRRRVSYEIVPGPNLEAEVRAGGVQLTPTEVSGILLKNMKDVASRALGHEVMKAVVTVPAYFNHSQRKSTIEAGAAANLEILRLINEPTAAALAYGYRKDLERRILVFDLGGGTFDVSLLEVGNDVYEVLTTNGDTFLGGHDFDNLLVDTLVDRFRQAEGIDLRGDRQAMQRLKDASEKAKCELSFTDRTQILIPQIHGKANLSADLTREDLEVLTRPLIERCMAVVKKTLSEAKIGPEGVDDVILVGGQPRMPAIQKAITEFFGKAPSKGVHPDEAVAVGAAIHGASLGNDESGLLLLDVTPFSLGIDSVGDIFSPVINKNATIPVSEKRTFTTVRDNQSEVHIVVRQGESRHSSENAFLGEFLLEGIKEAPRMSPKIDVNFRIDSNGILSVSAKDQETGERQAIAIRQYARLAAEGGSVERDEDFAGGRDIAPQVADDAKDKDKGGGFFAKLAGAFSFGKKSKAPAEPKGAEEEEFVDPELEGALDDGPDLSDLDPELLASLAAKAGVGAGDVSTSDLPEASALGGELSGAAHDAAGPASQSGGDELDDEEIDLDGAAELLASPGSPSGGELFAVSPPAPTVGESPADPFDAQEIDDLLGDDWGPDSQPNLDVAAPPVMNEPAVQPAKAEGQIDLDALEEALSDLDFELPEGEGEIDLESLSTLTQQSAANLPFDVEEEDDTLPKGMDPFDLAQAMIDERGAQASSPAQATDPFGLADPSAPAAAKDPFGVASKEEGVNPFADLEPFAITPKKEDPLGIVSKEEEEDVFADLDLSVLGDVKGEGAEEPGLGDIELSDDLFGLVEKGSGSDGDEAGAPSLTGEISIEDPFALDGDLDQTIRTTSHGQPPEELTGSFDIDQVELDFEGEESLATRITPPDEQTQHIAMSRSLKAESEADDDPFAGLGAEIDEEDDPFGMIDKEEFNLDSLVRNLDSEGGESFEDLPPDPFADGQGEDPFGIQDLASGIEDSVIREPDTLNLTFDGEEGNPFSANPGGDYEDDPFGITEKGDDDPLDDPFGITDADDPAFDDPFGLVDKDEDSPFGVDRDDDPFAIIDKAAAPPLKEEATEPSNGQSSINIEVKAARAGLSRIDLTYGRVDAFVKEGKESLSQAGSFFQVPNPLAVGSACDVVMSIPGIGESVKLRGQVVWSSKGRQADTEGMGIQFDLGHDGGGDKLRQLLADLAS